MYKTISLSYSPTGSGWIVPEFRFDQVEKKHRIQSRSSNPDLAPAFFYPKKVNLLPFN